MMRAQPTKHETLAIPLSFQLGQGLLLILLTSGTLYALELSTVESFGVLAAGVVAVSLAQRPWGGATLGVVAAVCLLAIGTTDDTDQLLWSYTGYGVALLAAGFLTPHVFRGARERIRSTTENSPKNGNNGQAPDD